MNHTRQVTMFIGAMLLAGLGAASFAGFQSHTLHLPIALGILALAAATSRMKAKLPGVHGNMSANLPFLLTAVVKLSAVEAVLIACACTAVQCWPRKGGKLNAQQMAFNLSMMAFASATASLMLRADWLGGWKSGPLGIAMATATLFLGQTAPVSGIVAMSERRSAFFIWRELAQLSFPYYVASAGLTFMVQTMSSQLGWGLALAVVPVMYGIHRSYKMYFQQMTGHMRIEVHARAAAVGA